MVKKEGTVDDLEQVSRLQSQVLQVARAEARRRISAVHVTHDSLRQF